MPGESPLDAAKEDADALKLRLESFQNAIEVYKGVGLTRNAAIIRAGKDHNLDISEDEIQSTDPSTPGVPRISAVA